MTTTDAPEAQSAQPFKLIQISRRAGGSEAVTLQQRLMDDFTKVVPHVTVEVVPGPCPRSSSPSWAHASRAAAHADGAAFSMITAILSR